MKFPIRVFFGEISSSIVKRASALTLSVCKTYVQAETRGRLEFNFVYFSSRERHFASALWLNFFLEKITYLLSHFFNMKINFWLVLHEQQQRLAIRLLRPASGDTSHKDDRWSCFSVWPQASINNKSSDNWQEWASLFDWKPFRFLSRLNRTRKTFQQKFQNIIFLDRDEILILK